MIVQRTPLNEFKKHESSAQIWIYFRLSPIRMESNIYKHSLKYFKRVSSAEVLQCLLTSQGLLTSG